jgi:hypothetical protein
MQPTARQREFVRIAGWVLPASITLGRGFRSFPGAERQCLGIRPGRRHRHCDLLHDPSARVCRP